MPIVRICMKLICRPSLSWRTNSLSVHYHLREFYLDPFLAAPLLMSEPFLTKLLKSLVTYVPRCDNCQPFMKLLV